MAARQLLVNRPNSTTVIDSKCLPRQDDPKGDPTAQRPWEPETPISAQRSHGHCSEDEVVEVECALSQTDATQIGQSPETPFVGVVRKGRGKSSCEHTDGRRKARTDSIHAVRDQQLRGNTRLFKQPLAPNAHPQHLCA